MAGSINSWPFNQLDQYAILVTGPTVMQNSPLLP